jgi:hypothetical protein
MFFRDVKADIALTGLCPSDDVAKRRVTDAVELLTNKGLIDPLTGEIAVCVCSNFVTLPAEVETPLAIQVDTQPTVIRNEWFTYHVNGMGDRGWTNVGFADILGQNFCTIRDPDRAVLLVTKLANNADANKKLRVYGWDADGKRIYTTGPDGNKIDGFLVPMMANKSAPNGAVPAIAKIDMIRKDVTLDYVDLYAVDPATNEVISTLGVYRPDEVVPKYVRLRVPEKNVVRVKFKRRDFEVRHDDDWLNVESRLGLIMAVKAVVARLNGQDAQADAYEMSAIRYVKDKSRSQRPGGIVPPQVIDHQLPNTSSGMFYS